RPDLVHIHGMRPLEFYAEKRVPLVYTNHTSGYLKRIKKGGYRIALLKRLFAKPDLFLAPSEELLEIPFEIRAIKRFISNGVISSKFNHDEQQRVSIRSRLGLPDDAVLAIVTRRMVWKNGVRYLAEAMQYLNNTRLHLLFIGDGEERAAVETLLQQYLPGRYIMLGAMQHEEIIPYYSAADLSILPSLMEATSISGLEAMAASLPLVGTRVGGIPVLIKDGENGYLCEPANPRDLAEKIDLLLSGDLESKGQQSRRMVEEQFDWREIARQTLEAYRLVLP
ncbi:MAG: glycosyltransferase family 4 protein, partial [Chromatiales bacterium]